MTPAVTIGSEARKRARTLIEDQPRHNDYEQHLQVAEHGGDACSDCRDGVRPQDEVDGKGEACSGRLPALGRHPASLAALLEDGDKADEG
jgi:hypothetical protein